MNTKIAAAVVGAAVLTAGAALAVAGDEHGKGHGRRGFHRAEMLEKYDVNKDGKLDDSEREAMKEKHKAHREEMLQRFDTDKDGELSDSERDAMRSEMRGRRNQQ